MKLTHRLLLVGCMIATLAMAGFVVYDHSQIDDRVRDYVRSHQDQLRGPTGPRGETGPPGPSSSSDPPERDEGSPPTSVPVTTNTIQVCTLPRPPSSSQDPTLQGILDTFDSLSPPPETICRNEPAPR